MQRAQQLWNAGSGLCNRCQVCARTAIVTMEWIFNVNKWKIILLLLGQAARNMVLQEDAILHSEDSLRKMAIITTHLQYQQEAIQKNVEQSSDLQDQLNHLLK
ncbi:BLOC-1-related complex subunit 7 isoform X2 [Talpa occidentalis]|uniref:BLOC-1-related complex subunit 7 isoform X2 n=1 Tax=Talpa occidentalis TaxID=50954 RepID=UPI00188E87AD|nr:BLOC-1-related complex subunit 7 isoform X2 [Talpa occidentalis]